MSQRQEATDQGRRRLLKALAAIGAGAAAAGAGLIRWDLSALVAEAAEPAKGKRRWVMVIDLRRCEGCEQCTRACREMHYLPEDQSWIKVYKMEGASGTSYALPRTCMMCESPPCLRVCPVQATYKDDEGIVLIDQQKCIGCRICMAACPYEARYFNFDDLPPTPATIGPASPEHPVPQQKGTVGKCVFCIHNLRFGKIPYCVESCTMEAIYIGDTVEDVATNGREAVKLSRFLKENDAIRYKEELGTGPRVYYILGHGQDLNH